MAYCIFCPTLITASNEAEHILHNAFGGRKTTKRVICSGCNNKFGGSIDKALTEQFSVIRNIMQIASGTGGRPPKIKRIRSGKRLINLESDGIPKEVRSPFSIEAEHDGKRRVHFHSQSAEEITFMIPNIAAALNISEERVIESICNSEATFTEQRPDPIELNLSFGGADAMRAVAKSCLVLWAMHRGINEINKVVYTNVRSFVNGTNNSFLAEHTFVDPVPLDVSAEIVSKYGHMYNLIYVRSDNAGKVVGHYTVFNLIAFSVVLAASGGSPNEVVGIVSNPLQGDRWSDKAGVEFNIPIEQLCRGYSGNFDEMTGRLDSMMKEYYSRGRINGAGKIISDIFARFGLSDNDVIPPEVFHSIVPELTHRLAHHFMGLKYEVKLSPEELRARITRPRKIVTGA